MLANLYTLTNSHGLEARFSARGAALVSLSIARGPNLVVGHSDPGAYAGAVVGRFAGRIAQGRFALGGRAFELSRNDGSNHLHGGAEGFDKKTWAAKKTDRAIEFSYSSPDGEEGYPGNLSVVVSYRLTEQNELVIRYRAETDKPTPVNLTHHAYFNLAGEGTILGHELEIAAQSYVPLTGDLIPTGEIAPTHATDFDFSHPTAIGARRQGDYDHCFVLGKQSGLKLAARLRDPNSGRLLEVLTTEPGLQIYTGKFLAASHQGIALEAQHFSDSPNQPGFPSTVLRPGELLESTTIYRIAAR